VLVPNAVALTPPYVEEIVPGSPAQKAGLRPDDLIVYVDGELVPSIKQYREIVKYARPGSEMILEGQRGSKLQTVRLKAAEHPKAKAPCPTRPACRARAFTFRVRSVPPGACRPGRDAPNAKREAREDSPMSWRRFLALSALLPLAWYAPLAAQQPAAPGDL